jgi:hypothetical protein
MPPDQSQDGAGRGIDPARLLLSEGLDLCVRARKLDEMHGQWCRHVRGDLSATRSATVPLWAQEQYDRDLADWERRAREELSKAAGVPGVEGSDA